MEEKDFKRKLKNLIYLYFHKDTRLSEYTSLLSELDLTDEIVSNAINRCKYDDDFRSNSIYSVILEDFDTNATNEQKLAVYGIILLYLFIEKQNKLK